ncbi:MAG TPA: ABC transporter permease [Thermoanaerobaculia bacterium]|nr:ABC transporter permease [Thermoanaerobaculia bacterium]
MPDSVAVTMRWTEIDAEAPAGRVDLAELWRYRELVQILVWRDLKVRYRQTLLGVTWVLIQPLLTTLIFTFLFNRVAHIQAGGGIPYVLFVLAGITLWNLFSSGVQSAGNSLISSAHVISKVYFPRLIIPAAALLSGLADVVVTACLLIVLMFWYGVAPPLAVVLAPVLVAICYFLALGGGLWLAALNVEYRDVRVLIPFLLQFGMYVTPVVYPLTALPDRFRRVAYLNPMTGVVEAFRGALFGTGVPWGALIWSMAVTVLLMISGIAYFRKKEGIFADML